MRLPAWDPTVLSISNIKPETLPPPRPGGMTGLMEVGTEGKASFCMQVGPGRRGRGGGGAYLQQLVPNADAAVAGRGPPGCDAHHKDAHAGAVAVSCQAQTQALPLLVQLHQQQLPGQLAVSLPDSLYGGEEEDTFTPEPSGLSPSPPEGVTCVFSIENTTDLWEDKLIEQAAGELWAATSRAQCSPGRDAVLSVLKALKGRTGHRPLWMAGRHTFGDRLTFFGFCAACNQSLCVSTLGWWNARGEGNQI